MMAQAAYFKRWFVKKYFLASFWSHLSLDLPSRLRNRSGTDCVDERARLQYHTLKILADAL
jgi:hypothetical protein